MMLTFSPAALIALAALAMEHRLTEDETAMVVQRCRDTSGAGVVLYAIVEQAIRATVAAR